MLSRGLTTAMKSPGGARAGTSGSPWGKTSLSSTGSEQDEEWEQLMNGRLCLRDHKKGRLLELEDTSFYCRVSTKASNSRTFFSCTASFSGSESCARRGEKSCSFREAWAEEGGTVQQCWARRAGFRATEQAANKGLRGSVGTTA